MASTRHNSLFGFLGFLLPTVVTLVAYPILVQSLGTKAFGIYVLATSVGGALTLLDLGVSAATLKFVAEDFSRGDRTSVAQVVVTSATFYGILGMFGSAVIWIATPYFVESFSVDIALSSEATSAFRTAAIQFSVFLLTTVCLSFFKGMRRFHWSTTAVSLLSLLTYSGSITAVKAFGFGLSGVALIGLLANIIVLVMCCGIAYRVCRVNEIPITTARPSFVTFRRMFSFSSIMAVNSLAGTLLNQAQYYLVGIVIGPAAVTVYQLATMVPSKAHSVVSSVAEVMFPLASARENRAKLRSVYLKMLFGSALTAAALLAPLMLAPELVISLWVGPTLAAQAAPLVRVFSVAFLFMALSPAPYHLINGLGMPWINSASFALSALTNVGLLALFAIYGLTLERIAWAFTIAIVVNSVAYQFFVEIFIWRRQSPSSDAIDFVSSRSGEGGDKSLQIRVQE